MEIWGAMTVDISGCRVALDAGSGGEQLVRGAMAAGILGRFNVAGAVWVQVRYRRSNGTRTSGRKQ